MVDRGEPRLPPVLATAQIRDVESRHAGDDLMERAGAAATDVAVAMLGDRAAPVVVLAGPGNNGGDGFVVARRLRAAFFDVVVVFPADAGRLPADAAHAYAAYVAAGGTTVDAVPQRAPALIVDSLFGLGLSRPLDDPWASLVRWANTQAAPTLALDIPTGLDADTGVATAPAIRAEATATFIALKPGLLTADGPDLCGRVSVHTLGLDPHAHGSEHGRLLEWSALAAALPEPFRRRSRAVHKGTFGTVGILGGATGMVGAALLAGRAGLRCGAGKVRVGFIDGGFPAVDAQAPELMLAGASAALDAGADVWVAGCGFGKSESARRVLERAIASDTPLVIDADALNLLAVDAGLRAALRARAQPTIATPHPAEAARLAGGSVADVQHDRPGAALAIARELRAHVVLKGAGTVIAHPPSRYDINASGNPALAFGGSGDVLAGMLGACLAQHPDAVAASRIAVCLHGAAADALVARGTGPIGVSALELIDAARELLNRAAFGDRQSEPPRAR